MIRWYIIAASQVLLRDAKTVASVYLILTVVLSYIFSLFEMPPFYLTDSQNVFNQYVFKSSYNITVVVLLVFSVAAVCALDHYSFDYMLRPTHVKDILKPVGRIGVSWILFYIVKKLIDVVAVMHGECEGHPEYRNQELLCTYNGHRWNGFRASGHAFYLLYSMLLMLEETKVFKYWLKGLLGSMATLHDEEHVFFRYHPRTEIDRIVSRRHWYNYQCYGLSAPVVTCTYVFLAIWMVLLNLNMFITIAYFHYPEQKVIGALLAYGLWWLTYRFIFQLEVDIYSIDFRKPRTSSASSSTSSSRNFFYPCRGPRPVKQPALKATTPSFFKSTAKPTSTATFKSISKSTSKSISKSAAQPPPPPPSPQTAPPKPVSELVFPSTSKVIIESDLKPDVQPVSQSTLQRTLESAPDPAPQPVTPSATQTTAPPVDQSSAQPAPEPALEPAPQPVLQSPSQSAPQPTSEPPLEPVVQPPSQSAPQSTTQSDPDPVKETIVNEKAGQD